MVAGNRTTDWLNASRECISAAQVLKEKGHFRGCINRCYYAAYVAITSCLVLRKLTFPAGRQNPPHDMLPKLIAKNILMDAGDRKLISAAIR